MNDVENILRQHKQIEVSLQNSHGNVW